MQIEQTFRSGIFVYDLLYGALDYVGEFFVGAVVVFSGLEEDGLAFGVGGDVSQEGVDACRVEFSLRDDSAERFGWRDVDAERGAPAGEVLE